MKKYLCGLMLVAGSFAMIGCEASVKTGDPDKTTNGSSYEKKTVTTQAPNGDVTTHTEMNKTN
jgi:hypothetical protein